MKRNEKRKSIWLYIYEAINSKIMRLLYVRTYVRCVNDVIGDVDDALYGIYLLSL